MKLTQAFSFKVGPLALMTASSLGTDPRQKDLPPLPGAAKTKEEVLTVFRHYPWIYKSLWPLDLWQEEVKVGRPKESILKDAMLTIQKYDRIIFDQAMRLYPQSSSPPVSSMNLAIERIFDNSMEWDLYFKSPLIAHYFGGIETRRVDPKAQSPLLSEEIAAVQKLLNSVDELYGVIPMDARLTSYFQRLARVMFPRKFGYAAPHIRNTYAPPIVDRPIFRPVREPECLPPNLGIFAQRTIDSTVLWIRCDRVFESRDFKDVETLGHLWNHIPPRHRLDLRLEITLIDCLPLEERLLRETLVKSLPTIQKVRFIKKTVQQESHGTNAKVIRKLIAVEDYDVRTGETKSISQW